MIFQRDQPDDRMPHVFRALAGLEPPFRKSNKRAAGPLPALDTIRGAQEFRVRLIDGLERTKIQTDLAAADAASPYHQPPTRFIPRGSGAPVGG
jgi:hypothetical protein